MAAVLILQSFMDSRSGDQGHGESTDKFKTLRTVRETTVPADAGSGLAGTLSALVHRVYCLASFNRSASSCS